MFHPIRTILAGASIVAAASINAQTATTTATADQIWNNLAKPSTSGASRIRYGKEGTAEELKARIMLQADEALQRSIAARNFYLQYPTHPKAMEARRIEAISALRAVKNGDLNQERSALVLAASVRATQSLPLADRCEVALAMERYQRSLKLKAKTSPDTIAEWAKVADSLKMEFGDLPVLQAYYLELARKADGATATTLATNIIRSPAAAPAVRAEAQSILDRASLVGRPVPLTLAKFGGGEVDLAHQNNRPVVLVIWSPSEPDSLNSLKSVQQNIPQSVQIVYMAVGGTTQQLLGSQPLMPTRGEYCYAPTPNAAQSFLNALKLKYAPMPCIYVLNKTGQLTGIARPKDLPALLVRAMR